MQKIHTLTLESSGEQYKNSGAGNSTELKPSFSREVRTFRFVPLSFSTFSPPSLKFLELDLDIHFASPSSRTSSSIPGSRLQFQRLFADRDSGLGWRGRVYLLATVGKERFEL